MKLLQVYHAALVENGVTDYSFEQCMADYRLAMFLPLNHTMLGLTYLDFSKGRGPELAAVILERTAAILQDHKVKDLFDALAGN
jgi:hypothetical protein